MIFRKEPTVCISDQSPELFQYICVLLYFLSYPASTLYLSRTCTSTNMQRISTAIPRSLLRSSRQAHRSWCTSAAQNTPKTPSDQDESSKVLTVPDGINESLQRMEYAVRGAIVQRAEQLSEKLRDSASAAELPFSRVILCNIGNPQSVGQTPVTYIRQVLAAMVCPSLLDTANLPSDVVKRVRLFLKESHGVGAYTESPGLRVVRKGVADAIFYRDGVPCSPDHVFLTNGASEAAKTMLSMLIRSPNDGVMIPIPQYPLYSATMTALGGSQVSYYLDEDKAWELSIDELQRSLDEARERGVCVRAIVVINPGNPTGQVLSVDNMVDIVRFCEKNRLVILADEVYQNNVYVNDKPFVSFKKVVAELDSSVELASFHSISKGVLGECGIRGGYVEIYNMMEETRNMIYKILSVSLCSNVMGQVAVDLMMRPPLPDDPSYELYTKETSDIFNSLKRKSTRLYEALNSFEGVSCNRSEGAMYLFPKITLPEGAAREAERRKMPAADVLYCMELLEATGVCVVPGSGFGQRKGTLHFRTTFLPPEDQIDGVVDSMRRFHHDFLKRYS